MFLTIPCPAFNTIFSSNVVKLWPNVMMNHLAVFFWIFDHLKVFCYGLNAPKIENGKYFHTVKLGLVISVCVMKRLNL